MSGTRYVTLGNMGRPGGQGPDRHLPPPPAGALPPVGAGSVVPPNQRSSSSSTSSTLGVEPLGDMRLGLAVDGAPAGLADDGLEHTGERIPCSLAISGATALVSPIAAARAAAWRSVNSSASR